MVFKIELRDMKFYAYHGVLPQETRVGNYFTVSLLLEAPLGNAVQTDDLEDTINYAAVYELVKKEMLIPSKLLEHAAGRILHSLKEHFPQITAIEVSLSKLNPPLGGEVYSASVILREVFS
ncbi:dihydroneopterin aldolase [Parabacteroides sp. PF5-5]|uniref:dihydroneopterin aldolase n=1 Tax=unclassified Parabacteroides TaxID=2649774 RepID=UPI00247481E2|nr:MULTISPECIES: dihydroneopterin aldolase [unclassified Parabacteroides]MDH6304523.1 dihydroneopterin aldolase [Parabacteroides sp. PH5-39]MDH6315325.1 dihydroneopterin aldolase [Parabacteroides sp. PF5-13]MDH6319181.1 dihydroneopterin aldolase [Parabacteroides sp. PH5-13]MDH6322912.1 dihydroneopterin aldolase [Parabacteroides sp. PH5-8]MDH6326516.1 dihydroneopterin aldolase [Parabacteroides sp. PH5-41]